jgi:hypothetical protein
VERYSFYVLHVECLRHIQNVLGEERAHALPRLPINVQVKFTLEQATKAHRGGRGIALLFL